ncbi:SCO family protein [Deinococcus sp.]|uniref:SCO family protein n=1 Tax=Deinococcus sp. TaxID=47478 RepID=UPI0025C6780F|nr:SCO family protein [Deinococcus sp.]
MTNLPAQEPLASLQREQAAPPVRPWYVSAALALCAVTLLLGGVWMFTRSKSPYPFFGTSYSPPAAAARFSGTDDLGKPFTFAPDGKTTTALFFGFTHCANICPVSLAYLAKVRNLLPASERPNFRILFVSVDPARDTVSRMHDYVTYFGQATGVVVPGDQLSSVAQAYGVGYQKSDIKGPDEYQISHTTATYLIDSAGKLRALWDYTQLPQVQRVAQDVQYVAEHPTR